MIGGPQRVRLAALLFAATLMPAQASPPLPKGVTATAMAPELIPGWRDDDHRIPLSIFASGCQAKSPLRQGAEAPPELEAICAQAATLLGKGKPDRAVARRFFEDRFTFWRVTPGDERDAGTAQRGFMTGYFEPEFEGALARSNAFPTPLYGRPLDLVTLQPGDKRQGLDPGLSAARKTSAGLEPFPDRAAIEAGALAGKGLEIAWLRDPVDRFVLQVQGSGRLRLADGTVRRLVYSGRNGHPYTSLGRVLSQREAIPPEQMTMDRLIARLKADAGFAKDLIALNRSFVFFAWAEDLPPEAGPIGGAGLPLTPLRSIAIDRTIWPYGLPAWIDATIPDGIGGTERLARLTVAQDTGSAILGPARVDLFVGSGARAGHRAGLIRHAFDFTVLWPRQSGR